MRRVLVESRRVDGKVGIGWVVEEVGRGEVCMIEGVNEVEEVCCCEGV